MSELPKKLKFANKNKTILTVKKHIHNYLKEPIDNIEILCKNFAVADSHSLEYIKKTKWQNLTKTMVLMYKRKKRIMSHANAKWRSPCFFYLFILLIDNDVKLTINGIFKKKKESRYSITPIFFLKKTGLKIRREKNNNQSMFKFQPMEISYKIKKRRSKVA